MLVKCNYKLLLTCVNHESINIVENYISVNLRGSTLTSRRPVKVNKVRVNKYII